MKTDELIALLATGAGAAEPRVVPRRYATALGWGAFGATLLMAIVLGVRPDLGEVARTPMFWVKLAFPASLLVAALIATMRLARPGVPLGRVPLALIAPVAIIWLLAGIELAGAAPPERVALVLGETWRSCPRNIVMLSIPAFVATFWAMRGLAPTNLPLAGAASGLLAASIGTLTYVLHCPEMAAPFLGTWYVAGMLIPAVAGTLLGPQLLRW